MIKGGYYLKARQIKNSSISKTAPCTREVWDYLIREANFADSKHLVSGQLIRSYQEIIKSLSWEIGARTHQYKHDQISKAMVWLRKHKMIRTERVTRGVLVTICNYKYFQNKQNYESSSLNREDTNKINTFEEQNNHESSETPSESSKKQATDSSSESSEIKTQNTIPVTLPSENTYHESSDESSHESSEKPSTIDNNNSIDSIEYYINLYNTNYPCGENEQDFERDRRIFFHSFPGVKTYQTFDDNSERKNEKLITVSHIRNNSMPAKFEMSLEKGNDMGAGIYMCINETNGKSRKAKDIINVRSVFADLDGSPIEPVWEYNPSMVVESSPGKFHAYWFTTDTPLESFRTMQESISEKFKSDPVVKDLPRVMRVPGFNHMKGEPFLSRIIHYTNLKFTFGYLVEIFPPIPREKWSAEKYHKAREFNPDSEFKGQYGANNGGRNNHIITRIGGMIKRGLQWNEIEAEAMKEAMACNPPLSESETRAILRSARRY